VPVPGVVRLLAALVESFGLVAIVSGRPVEFLRDRLPVVGLRLVGQYGLETLEEGGGVRVDPRAVPFATAIGDLADAAETELDGVLVERKGTIAVTLHWRERPDLGPAVERWAAAAATRHGLDRYPTRMAVELRPPVPVDKGSAVESLCDGRTAAMFAGDDHGDLSAFSVLERLGREGRLTGAVRIGVRSAEEPPDLLARTDLAVGGPSGLVEFLSSLVARA
jgi:trehalose 6-phosphate phosphatase